MNVKEYIGMYVHQETISIAVMTGDGKLVMESIIETKASTILQFIHGLQGDLHVSATSGKVSSDRGHRGPAYRSEHSR
jgi:hypothetical protein